MSRTPEEREAARQEREAARQARQGRGLRRVKQSSDDAPPVAEATPIDAEHEFADEPAGRAQQPDFAADGEGPIAYEDDRLDGEDERLDGDAPLGVRRVSRLQPDGKPTSPRKREPVRKAPRRYRVRSIRGRIMALVALILGIAILWFLYQLFQPFHGSGHGRVKVTIPQHSSVSQIADLLERDGVVSSSFFFQLRATVDGERSKLRAGTYRLKLDMDYGDVLKILSTAPPPIPTTTLTLIDGKSRQQIDALLRAQHIRGSYIAATRHSRLLNPTHYGAPRSTPDLEGFLFPSTYQLRKPVSIPALVSDQLKTFKAEFSRVNLSYARRQNLSPYDVLKIASIVEDEAATRHDYPLVASVIYNRLKDHMPLGMDSTTRYEFNDWTHPLTDSQLAARSPYNTRRNVGLPPTPIGNPGSAAINAAAHPSRTNYLYFVAGVCGNGSSVFSSSYQQFLRDSARYQTARARRGGSPVHC